jgi:hypothetical protein
LFIDEKLEQILYRLHCLPTFFNKIRETAKNAHPFARTTRHKIMEKVTNKKASILGHRNEVSSFQKQTKKKIDFRAMAPTHAKHPIRQWIIQPIRQSQRLAGEILQQSMLFPAFMIYTNLPINNDMFNVDLYYIIDSKHDH